MSTKILNHDKNIQPEKEKQIDSMKQHLKPPEISSIHGSYLHSNDINHPKTPIFSSTATVETKGSPLSNCDLTNSEHRANYTNSILKNSSYNDHLLAGDPFISSSHLKYQAGYPYSTPIANSAYKYITSVSQPPPSNHYPSHNIYQNQQIPPSINNYPVNYPSSMNHLNGYPSYNSTIPVMNSFNMSYDSKIKQLEYQLSLLGQENDENKMRNIKIEQLEHLLNKREYEIQELKIKTQQDISSLNSELSKIQKSLTDKEEKLISERAKYSTLQKDYEKLQNKLNDCNKYVEELPTMDEVKDTEKRITDLKNESDSLKMKMVDLEKKYKNAKLYIRERNQEIENLNEKISKLELEKEKIKLEFENYKQATSEVGDLMLKCEENSSLKAELECSVKLANSLKDKMKLLQQKHEEKLTEMREKLNLELDISDSLRVEIENKEKSINDLQKSLLEISNKNQSLMNEKLNLEDKLISYDTLMSNDSLKQSKILFKELNLCTSELDSIVRNFIDLQNGKQIDICDLLGSSNRKALDNSIDDDMNKDSILNIMNIDFLIKKTQSIKSTRSKLFDIRKIMSDEYAEKIGSNISCIQQ